MPFYDIHHHFPLDQTQRGEIASRITALHCTHFTTPSLFLNIRFTQDDAKNISTYVGGERVGINYIHAHIRPRKTPADSEVRELYNSLIIQIAAIWQDILGYSAYRETGSLETPMNPHSVFVLDDIAAGYEQGFLLPEAGGDKRWIEENMREFERRANAEAPCEDHDMQRLVKEIHAREDLS
ncbi:uncharacterized protein BDZ99DRAFT_473764 [Mytilinidion resinicola]|uniref:Tautomerase cis-CaaD-like domain-containing protein n=1 Tax=Mytilinidion resinicola TaxID=574789 RepID=A0A6A6YWV2_9PEZI|nr:uncharacterized protein BDZ99DRAFT_473764 [Mytilinidion resinicola]KAF2813038.1 hypothetical protein BDZ99DRAFT_473764 [Mytilinidion resinicola]